MRTSTFIMVLSFLLTLALFSSPAALAQTGSPKHVKITMTPEFTEVLPGTSLFVVIAQEIDEGWHTYWVNPGDSGEPMRARWTMPAGFEAGELQWPVPRRIEMAGLTNYGYEGTALLLQEIRIPYDIPPGPLTVSAAFDILVCKEICIPENHEAAFTINDGSAATQEDLVAQAYATLAVAVNWDAQYREKDGTFEIDMNLKLPRLIRSGGDKIVMDIFPYEWGVIDNTAATGMAWLPGANNIRLGKKRGDRALAGIGPLDFLVAYEGDEGWTALRLTAYPDPATTAAEAPAPEKAEPQTAEAATPAAPRSFGLGKALLFALIGGLILNLMPCVFPVLSIKALGLVRMSEKNPAITRRHGIAYTLGVMLSFLAIAALLIALQTAGAQIGWGFQLQNPLVVLLLAYLLFLVGLNLSGYYDIGLPAFAANGKSGDDTGPAGSFMTGVLATLVATPCTAPFMGAAMGFAMTQPPAIALSVFAALGFGLALPYLLLSIYPPLRRFLPKPGNWMVVFKELLAFPIYASVAWLVWVYSQQAGALALLYALAGFVGIGFAVWIFRYRPAEAAGRWALRGLALLVLASVLAAALNESMAPRAAAPAAAINESDAAPAKGAAVPFTPQSYRAALDAGTPVFVNMTAAWCITCKVNERVALNTAAAQALFAANNIAYLKGDWTNQDPAITEYLARYGRNGVPLYVYYAPADPKTGNRPDPVVLPQLLTPGILAETVGANEGRRE